MNLVNAQNQLEQSDLKRHRQTIELWRSYLAIDGHVLRIVFEDCGFVSLRKYSGDEDITQTRFPNSPVANNNDLDFRRRIKSARRHSGLHFHKKIFKFTFSTKLTNKVLVERFCYLKLKLKLKLVDIWKLRYWFPFSHRPFAHSLRTEIIFSLKLSNFENMIKTRIQIIH